MARTDTTVLVGQPGDQFKVRFPDGLRESLKVAAKANKRSVNAEVVSRLEASFQTSSALNGEIAAMIAQHVDAEVQRRLREIALKIGGAQ